MPPDSIQVAELTSSDGGEDGTLTVVKEESKNKFFRGFDGFDGERCAHDGN